MSVRFSTFEKSLRGDMASRVHAILMIGQMKSRLNDAVESMRAFYAETPISFAEYAAFRRGLAGDGWRCYQPVLIALGDKVHARLSAMLHDSVLAPRVLEVLMRSGGQSGVRAALGHAPHLIPYLLQGEAHWQQLAVDGLPEGLARRRQADEDGPGGVLAYLTDFAKHLARNPEDGILHNLLAQALREYQAGTLPEVAAWGEITEILSASHPELSALARSAGEKAYRDLLLAYADRPLELPVHYLHDLGLCADSRALPLLEAMVLHNSARRPSDHTAGSGEPCQAVPFPGAEELRERFLATALAEAAVAPGKGKSRAQGRARVRRGKTARR